MAFEPQLLFVIDMLQLAAAASHEDRADGRYPLRMWIAVAFDGAGAIIVFLALNDLDAPRLAGESERYKYGLALHSRDAFALSGESFDGDCIF